MAPTASKVTILFIQASPPDQAPLDTGTEMNRLEDALGAGLNPTLFDVRTRTAVRSQDIEPSLRRHRPQVIHFSGHGSRAGESILNAPDGAAGHPLSAEDFAEKLRRYNKENPEAAVRLVVLAGCYTDRAAELLSEFLDCAVGMADRVDDRAMVDVFSPTLYRALGDGYSVAAAVAEARQELRADPHGYGREAEAAKLHARTGMDPDTLKLTQLAQPVSEINDAHRKYLRQLFEQPWACVSMRLFDPTLGHKFRLADIYTPLPVDFAIHGQVGKGGRFDWWCGRRGEDLTRFGEVDAAASALDVEMARRGRLKTGEGVDLRPRRWVDLEANEQALKPLVALVQAPLKETEPRRKQDRDEERTTTWVADAHHAALVRQRYVLVGDPGSGKTTFLRHLALCWAGETLCAAGDTPPHKNVGLAALTGWTGPAYTPIYLELRALVAGDAWALDATIDPPGVKWLREYLRARLTPEGCEACIDDLFDLLRAGRAAILLDGLDEVSQAADERRRAQIQTFVGELAEEFDAAPIIITARPYAYGQDAWRLPGFGHTTLVPLDRSRQTELAGRIFAALAASDPRLVPAGAEQETATFVAALTEVPDDLASNPLLLTLLMTIWLKSAARGRSLPSTRGALYRRGLDLLLEDWVQTKIKGFSIQQNLKLNSEDLRLVLQLVACQAQETRTDANQAAVITEADFFTALRSLKIRGVAEDLLDHLEQLAGMLLEAVAEAPGVMIATYEKRFRFLHLTFQEHLAACELLYRPDSPRPHDLRVLQTRLFPEALVAHVCQEPILWANVLRLAVDELLAQKRDRDAWELLSRCCQPYLASRSVIEAAVIAFQTVEKAGLFAAVPPDRLIREDYKTICASAQKMLIDYEQVAPEQRDIAGRLLGSGPGHDPRPGVGLRADHLPAIDWVEIPKVDPQTHQSAWTYQNKKHEPLETFWIARYPVTYAQYRAFLEAKDGFANPEWWRGLAAPKEDRRRPGEQRFPYWNHPAENVSWYDAVAFCRWLTAKVKAKVEAKVEGWETLLPPEVAAGRDLKITLPTEWQWEKAARGHDGREFPWGKEYVSGNANIDETYGTKVGPHYLQKTNAVGMYPYEKPAKSPYGVADLSGNVWEWCLNEYEQPERTQEEGDATRVVRGGSWFVDVGLASALARLRGWHYVWVDLSGFRVVVAASVPFS